MVGGGKWSRCVGFLKIDFKTSIENIFLEVRTAEDGTMATKLSKDLKNKKDKCKKYRFGSQKKRLDR